MGDAWRATTVARSQLEAAKWLRIPVEEQCGIIACSVFSGKTIKQVIKVVKKLELYDRISNYKEKDARRTCLYCRDIKRIMKDLGYGIQDCRFCSFKRDTRELMPMPEYVNGIVALKLDANGGLVHWVAYKDGEILDGENEFASVKELKKRYTTFDGFGFKLSIWNKEDFDILENTMSVYCKSCSEWNGNICKNCSRESFCLEKRVFDVVKIKSVMDTKDLSSKKCGGWDID